jgi:hypothetical protein
MVEWVLKALAIFEELDAPFYTAITQGELGTCYLQPSEADRALQLLERTAGIFLTKGFSVELPGEPG